MANQAARDQNRVTTLLGVDSIAFTDPTTAAVDPTTHALLVTPVASGVDQDVNLVAVGGSALTLGQKTSANSIPVVLASDQSTLSISGTVTANAGTNLNTSSLLTTSAFNTVFGSSLFNSSNPLNVQARLFDGASFTATPGDFTNGTLVNLGVNNDVIGNIASGATDSGNPIKVGGIYNSTKPTFTDGQRGDLQLGTRGSLVTQISGANSTNSVNVNASSQLSVSVDNTPAVTMTSTAITSVVPGTGNTSLGAAVDAVRGATKTGVVALTIRKDIPTNQVTNDGDYAELQISNDGRLWVSDMPIGSTYTPYSVRITTNTTTTPTSATAYVSSITISSEIAGTTSTLTIQDKQGTPLKLVNGLTTVAITTTPTILNFQTPVKMTSGIDVITAGVGAATLDIWINYYQ